MIDNGDKVVIHRNSNSKRTFVSAELELGFDEEEQNKKTLMNALLCGQPLNGNNHSLTNNMSKLRNLGKPNVKKQKLQSTKRTKMVSSCSAAAVQNLKDEMPLILRSNDEVCKLAENFLCKESTYTSAVTSTSTSTSSATTLQKLSNKTFAFDDGLLYGHNIVIVGQLTKRRRKVASNQPKDSFTEMEDKYNTGSVSPSESVEARQPSPVSVLESPLEPKRLHRRVMADPQELQKQLDILKFELEQVKEATKREGLHLIEDIKLEFTCEEERDYTYVLDMVIDSGFHGVVEQKRLLRICYDRHSPVGPMVFSNLEKKYKEIGGWSVWERKLLFDLVNSILAEILAPCMDLRPWATADRQLGPMWGHEGLVEKLWHILTTKKDLLLLPKGKNPLWKAFDYKWIKLGDQIDLIAREIERSIKDQLLEELVSEFLLDY